MDIDVLLIINLCIYISFIIVAFKSKDDVLKWTFYGLLPLYTFYALVGARDIKNPAYLILGGLSATLSIFMIIYKIRMLSLTWRPILTTMLFLVSYAIIIFQKGLISFGIPWFTGYVLVTITFIVGLVLYRKELRYKKTVSTK